jgi:hypothetical protein
LRNALLILLFGSRAVLADVSFAFMPFIRLQKPLRRAFAFGDFFACFALTGGLRL